MRRRLFRSVWPSRSAKMAKPTRGREHSPTGSHPCHRFPCACRRMRSMRSRTPCMERFSTWIRTSGSPQPRWMITRKAWPPTTRSVPENSRGASPRTQSGADPIGSAPPRRVPPSSYSPTGKPGSTIAEAGLNFRVRNGNGCGPCSMDGGIKALPSAIIDRRISFWAPRSMRRACDASEHYARRR